MYNTNYINTVCLEKYGNYLRVEGKIIVFTQNYLEYNNHYENISHLNYFIQFVNKSCVIKIINVCLRCGKQRILIYINWTIVFTKYLKQLERQLS
jgi:hypothetical protein